jgi:hypothetical protein
MDEEVEDFAAYLVREGPAAVAWLDVLRSYQWAGMDWRCGVHTRERFHAQWLRIREANPHAETPPLTFRAWADDVTVNWGGINRPIGAIDLGLIWRSLIRDKEVVPWVASARAASAKVYHMSAPGDWAIFDSRVGRAMQQLLLDRFDRFDDVPVSLRIRCPEPKIGRLRAPPLPRGFEYANTAGQFRHGFLVASDLCQRVAEILRHPDAEQPGRATPTGGGFDDGSWHVCHVEMALFMLGARAGKTRDA